MDFRSPELKLDLENPDKIGNLSDKLDDNQRHEVADHVIEMVKIDEMSMSDWLGKANDYLEDMNKDANKTMPQANEQQGSGEDQPPSTSMKLSSCVQATARIVSAILSEPDLVKASEPGGEPLAQWICSQLRTIDPDWIIDTDPLIFHMTVTGLGWRKRWYDEYEQEFRSAFLNVNEVIINSNAKSLDRVPRITHKIEKYPYEIKRSIAMGHWVDYEPEFNDADPQELKEFYEVDMWLDMDGDDYEEPYTITVNLDDIPCAVKILPRWTKRTIVSTKDSLIFRPVRRYYAYKMIPDPDGCSFFPRGYGWLLDKTENVADRLLASITDIAMMSGENGGIAAVNGIGLPDKIEVKSNRFNTINTDGRPVNDVFSFFPTKQVTPAMFQTLDKMYTQGDRLSGSLNLMENAPASMTATLAKGIIDQGAQQHSAVHRRILGSMTEEVRAFARMADAMNYLPENIDADKAIEITADPNMATEMHRAATAQAYHDMLQLPMIFNPHEVGLRYAQTMRFPDPEKLIAPPPPEPQATPKEQMDVMLSMEKEKTNRMKAHAQVIMNISAGIKSLADAAAEGVNLDLMKLQIAQLDLTVQQMADAANSPTTPPPGTGGQPPFIAPPNVNPRMAGTPANPAAQVGPSLLPGPGNGGIPSGQTNGSAPAGTRTSLPPDLSTIGPSTGPTNGGLT